MENCSIFVLTKNIDKPVLYQSTLDDDKTTRLLIDVSFIASFCIKNALEI